MVMGEDIQISINSDTYSTYIESFTESGGEKVYTTVKTFGNNYVKTLIGRNNYEVSFDFRLNSDDFQTLLDITTPMSIEITLGSDSTIYYYNMLPISNNITTTATDLVVGTISFEAPAYDITNARYNKIIQ